MNNCFPDIKTVIVVLGVTFIVIALTSEPRDLIMMWNKARIRIKNMIQHFKKLVK